MLIAVKKKEKKPYRIQINMILNLGFHLISHVHVLFMQAIAPLISTMARTNDVRSYNVMRNLPDTNLNTNTIENDM